MDIKTLFPQVAKSAYGRKLINILNPMTQDLIQNPNDKILTLNVVLQLRYHPDADFEQKIVFGHLADLAINNVNSFIDLYKQFSSDSSVLGSGDNQDQ